MNQINTASFEIKGGMQTILTLHLYDSEKSQIEKQLHDQIGQAPNLFSRQALIIDVSKVTSGLDADTLIAIKNTVKLYGLILIGVSGCSSIIAQEAVKAAQLSEIKLAPKRKEENKEPEASPAKPTPPPPAPAPAAKDIYRIGHVRSGQEIESSGNIVVVGNVSRGAEIVAGGTIHVYGNLLGRAIAGASGRTNSKIFALGFDPELVCICGFYSTSDESELASTKPGFLSLVENEITFSEINTK